MYKKPKWDGLCTDIFGCYICYYLHYVFKMSTLLKYNLLLLISLITCQLNLFWAFFKLHGLIQMYLLLLKINTLVAIFKCLQKIFCKEKAGLWSLDSSVYRLSGSIKHQTQWTIINISEETTDTIISKK